MPQTELCTAVCAPRLQSDNRAGFGHHHIQQKGCFFSPSKLVFRLRTSLASLKMVKRLQLSFFSSNKISPKIIRSPERCKWVDVGKMHARTVVHSHPVHTSSFIQARFTVQILNKCLVFPLPSLNRSTDILVVLLLDYFQGPPQLFYCFRKMCRK